MSGLLTQFKKYYFLLLPIFARRFKFWLLASLGVIWALCVPAYSANQPSTKPEALAQQGQLFYQTGKLNEAIDIWQKAAKAYEAKGDVQQQRNNLINSATAEQKLGLYNQSCTTIFEAFNFADSNCSEFIEQSQTWESQLQANTLTETEFQEIVNNILSPLVDSPASSTKAIALLRLGDFLRAKQSFQTAITVLKFSQQTAEQLNNPEQNSAILISLGNTTRAIAMAKQNRFPPKTIALDIIANRRGLASAALEPYQPAIQYYQQAALEFPNSTHSLKARLNHLSLLLDNWEFWQKAITELQTNINQLGITDQNFLRRVKQGSKSLEFAITTELQPQIQALTQVIKTQFNQSPPDVSQIYSRINFAHSLIRQGLTNADTAEMLAVGIKQARQLQNSLAEAEVTGYMGYLYQQEKEYSQARRLTETALALAPNVEYPEIAYRWQAQLGGILAQQEERTKALSAYEASFNTIKALRSDLATTPVEPIFREYISLLLQEEPSPEQLNQARNVLESLQIAELDNFFRDPCSEVAEENIIIDEVDRKAAVIYPIILRDRLEVILTLPGQPLQRYTTQITESEVKQKIEQLRLKSFTNPGFAEALRGARGNSQQQQIIQNSLQMSLEQDILPLAQEMYDWLIAPAETILEESQVETLVFVLDGALRNIPMAILHDGEKYLIEKDYNIALSSGLQLTAPKPLKRQPIKVLAAGTTQAFPEYNFPPIPKVEAELEEIKRIFGDSEVLLNQEFTPENLQRKLTESDYPVVHLATHGQFGSTSDRTFILSGNTMESDRLINVNQLDNLLRVRTLRNFQPIELLVLSACNTAQGDNQAVLGLAGVAVRAGARSTLATLWGANDNATAELMGYFYQNLANNSEISKAKALKDAQLTLIQTPDSQYYHPYYWAPFVLVGNWL